MCKKDTLKKMSSVLTSLIMTLILMLNIIPATRVSAYLSDIGTFDLNMANEYASMYAESYNPNYGVYGTDGTRTFNPSSDDLGPNGKDCAHYVSQILIYAGANVEEHINVNDMRNYYVNCGIEYISSPSVSQIEAGDILYTSSSHVMFVQRVVNGIVYATGHTNARLNYPVSLKYGVLKTSVMCNSNNSPSPAITIDRAVVPGSIHEGDNYILSGEISSGIPLTSVKVYIYDGIGNCLDNSDLKPNGATSYSITGTYIENIPAGMYRCKVTASNAELSDVTLIEKVFSVLSNSPTLSNGTYRINVSYNSSYVMGVTGMNDTDNVRVYVNSSQSGQADQTWCIDSRNGGFYTIKNFESGLYLDVYYGDSTEGTNIQQCNFHGGDNQLWQILPAGGGTYCLVPKCALESSADVNGSDGTNVAIYNSHLGENQRFVFTKIDADFVSGNKIYFNPNGGTLPSAYASYTVNRINKEIGSGELGMYNISGQTVVAPNDYCAMITVNYDGQVLSVKNYAGSKSDTVPSGGFILMGHCTGSGNDGSAFLEQIEPLEYVGYNSTNKTAYVYKNRVGYLVNHKYVKNGSSYGMLPSPSLPGYSFEGWYTSASGGTKITSDSSYSVDTLYAHWEIDPGVPINSTTFPDENFRKYVSDEVDTDKDGNLSKSELNKSSLSVANKGINNLDGIEYFTSLSRLYCQKNNLTRLDLGKNTQLMFLNCSENKLSSLHLDNNAMLQIVFSDNNIFDIGIVKGSYSVSNLTKYGFDPTRASNWSGAKYDSSSKILYDFTSTTISYDYDCGNGQKAKFSLNLVLDNTTVKGDVDGDGKVNNRDLILLKYYLSHSELGYSAPADIDDNGLVNNRDLIALKYLLSKNL